MSRLWAGVLFVVSCAAQDLSFVDRPAPLSSVLSLVRTENATDPERRRLTNAFQKSISCKSGLHGSDVSVIYVHIFKAAGSTIRQKLRDYSSKCRKRWACLIHCEDNLVGQTMINCEVKDEINMPHAAIAQRKISHLKQADILGGHVRVPIRAAFKTARLITIMRNPIYSVASGVGYANPHAKLTDIVAKLRENIAKKEGYRNAVVYLYGKQTSVSPEEKYWEAAQNLGLFDLVGIVENWDVSMRMLQTYLDPTKGWSGWRNTAKRNENPNSFSTADVLAKLSAADMRKLRAHVAMEVDLYTAGLEAHYRTCRALLGTGDLGKGATCKLSLVK